MKLVTDLHMHSHYSRATSIHLDLAHLFVMAQKKGVHLLGTGDFTHPAWFQELQEQLVPIPGEEGSFQLRTEQAQTLQPQVPASCQQPVRFVLTAEISCIYKQNGAVRKVHNLVFVPHVDAARRLNHQLSRIGNLAADGRPILGMSSRDLLELVLASDPLSYLIPAHVWTPHFGALGAGSGFDRLEDCYGDLSSHVFAIETGLSSDPAMNHRLSALDRYSLMSSSDAHSPAKLAREATVVDITPSFAALREALEHADPKKLLGTIEFFPEEGKYHLDGHRACKVRWTPQERKQHKGICPICNKPVTIGVLSRIEALADRSQAEATVAPRARPFVNLVPLQEILSETLGVGPGSKRVTQQYETLLAQLGPELSVLQEVPLEDIHAKGGARLAEAIQHVRSGRLSITAGYDGEYGAVHIFERELTQEPTLFV